MVPSEGVASFGDLVARDLREISTDPACLDSGGWWAVAITFEGDFRGYRFADVSTDTMVAHTCRDIAIESWVSTLSRDDYIAAVKSVRDDIARGWVYQANICRVLTSRLDAPIDPVGLYQRLQKSNPSPHGGLLHVPGEWDIISASPELFLHRSGAHVTTSPIKGTAALDQEMLAKDHSENIMIVDLMRNDLSHVAVPGTVRVPHLLRREEHPGLAHLVSDVSCDLRPDVTWSQLLEATLPPGSVSGAPKSSALEVIQRLEPTPRGIYCGAFGWVDADNQAAELAVGIRTFSQKPDGDGTRITFGTGAGITWGSNPVHEWNETELKAHRLLSVAAGLDV